MDEGPKGRVFHVLFFLSIIIIEHSYTSALDSKMLFQYEKRAVGGLS